MDRDTLAKASKATYAMLGSKNKTERLMNADNIMEGTGFKAVDSLSGRDILYFKNDDAKQIIIAHRGTDISGFKTSADAGSDFLIAMGQEEQGAEFIKRKNRTRTLVKDAPEDYNLYLSGHSYGGASVNESLKGSKLVRDRVDGVATFNSAFSPFSKKGVGKTTADKLDEKVIHYRISGDVPSASVKINKPFGKVVEYNPKASVMSVVGKAIPYSLQPIFQSQSILNIHKLDNFIK